MGSQTIFYFHRQFIYKFSNITVQNLNFHQSIRIINV